MSMRKHVYPASLSLAGKPVSTNADKFGAIVWKTSTVKQSLFWITQPNPNTDTLTPTHGNPEQ